MSAIMSSINVKAVPTARPAARLRAKAPARAAPARKAMSVRATGRNLNTSSRPGETLEQTAARRYNESMAVQQRTVNIESLDELDAFLTEAGDNLVMVNIESQEECDLGNNPDAWQLGAHEASTHVSMQACVALKSDLARVARECPDLVFLNIDATSGNGAAMAKELGVTRFPTQQYYKNGQMVWQHVGAGAETMQSVGEGVLYFGGVAGGGVNSSDFITEVKGQPDLTDFLDSCAMPTVNPAGVLMDVVCEKQLAVLDVSLLNDSPQCMHVYPAVLALAKNTAGATRWARLLGDSGAEAKALMKSLNITQVPTFVFYADGKEVGRYAGGDRMAIMNKVLEFQAANGVVMPSARKHKRISTKEAKEIAKAAREKAKASMWKGQGF